GAAARPRPPGPRQAVCRDGPVGAGTCGAVHSYRDVSGHGDDLLAPGDGGSTGADGSTMIMGSATRPHRETLRPIVLQVTCPTNRRHKPKTPAKRQSRVRE